MITAHTIADLDAALAGMNISAAKLCRRADISESTWHRWKTLGTVPSARKWERVQDALRELAPDLACCGLGRQ